MCEEKCCATDGLIAEVEGTLLGNIIAEALAAVPDYVKAQSGNKKAGTRARNRMTTIKNAAHDLRKEILTFRGK